MRLFLFVAFLLVNNFSAQKTQNHLFYYKMVYDGKDSLRVKGESQFLLSVQDSVSVFSNVRNVHKDSILLNWKKQSDQAKSTLSMAGVPKTPFTYYIEKKRGTTEVSTYDLIGGKNFSYTEQFPSEQWKLKDSFKDYAGFKCQKAEIIVFGRKFIAWYTIDIPFQDGPYKFSGLPGLIIELYDSENIYNFSLIKYDPKDTQIISVPGLRKFKAKKTDKITFEKAKKSYQENLVERARSMGLEIDEQRAKQIRNRAKQKISPIEILPL